jgi:hypothetical protein
VSTTRPPATSTVGTIACTNGMSASSAPSRRTTRSSPPGPWIFELVDVELVGVVGGRERGGGDEEAGAAQRFGGRAVGCLGEADEQPPGVRSAGHDAQGAVGRAGAPRDEHGTVGEPGVG